jgi:phosphohistidine phosphatase
MERFDMQKQLLIMRHAKADRDEKRWQDFDRPLNERGLLDAPVMGRWLEQKQFKFDQIIASPAVRTKDTARLVAEQLNYSNPIQTPQSLYEGSSREYIAQIGLCPASVVTILIVGHNPALEQVVERLTGQWITLKTSAVAYLRYSGSDWSEIKSESLEFVETWSPKTIAKS